MVERPSHGVALTRLVTAREMQVTVTAAVCRLRVGFLLLSPAPRGHDARSLLLLLPRPRLHASRRQLQGSTAAVRDPLPVCTGSDWQWAPFPISRCRAWSSRNG